MSKPSERIGALRKSPTEDRFTRMAETLDAAGLGPADYLYLPLKWRMQKPDVRRFSLRPALRRSAKELIERPLPVPGELRPAPILVASSYLVSSKLLRQVASTLGPADCTFYYPHDLPPQKAVHRLADRLRTVASIAPALIFAQRVRSALAVSGADPVERDRAASAAFVHRMHRATARAVLNRVRPSCLVIGNGNRPLEFAFWAEAKARKIATVLLPYTEVTLKPTRFLSLCRGEFDLVLPFSESSAEQIRRLKPDVATEIVGFPFGFDAAEEKGRAEDAESEQLEAKQLEVLYFAGTNFEAGAAELIKGALQGSKGIRLRVRLHPRAGAENRKIFDWLAPDDFSDPHQTPLAEDIKHSDVALAVRSTAAIEAMIAGIPSVWLSPESAREQLKFSTLRAQNLTPLEAASAAELKSILQGLREESERRRIAKEQWSRLRAAGYDRNYFDLVASALRRQAGIVRAGAED